MNNLQKYMISAVNRITIFDKLEKEHKQDALSWIKSGAPLIRISKPDNPPKHLVSYFVLFDEATKSVMLIDHITSGLWLPAGGHVESNESLQDAVIREAQEELKIQANFETLFGNSPFFVTVNTTSGQNQHTDVSLWYVIKGDVSNKLDFNTDEIKSCKWLTFDQALATDITRLDRHMHRCVNKMKRYLQAT
jgi:8-oxo-dGTP pyrophosphatase MutT (NUDIX family)